MARTRPQVPQLSINGSALSSHASQNTDPKSQSASSPASASANANANATTSPTARPPKPPSATATAAAEIDSAWGANFWVTLIEPQSQTPFYACPATGQVSWDPPVGNFVLPPSAEGEWWELVDESRGGIPYYYHTKTNETVWERPEGFIIPLAILQNTALCRRLSARYSQVIDPDVVKAYAEHQQAQSQAKHKVSNGNVNGNGNAHATSGEPGGRPAARRTASDNMASNHDSNNRGLNRSLSVTNDDKAMRRRSASASASGTGTRATNSAPTIRLVNSSLAISSKSGPPQTPKRTTFGHGIGHGHHPHHMAQYGHGFGGTHLPPIPASPYQSQTEGSASDAEAKGSGNGNGNGMEKKAGHERQGKAREEEREREREKERGRQKEGDLQKEKEADSFKRKSASVGPHTRSTHRSQPQSLAAIASRIAGDSTSAWGGGGSVPPTPVSPVPPTPTTDTRHDEKENTPNDTSFFPQVASLPTRSAAPNPASGSGQKLTISTGFRGLDKARENVLPTPTSPFMPSPVPPSAVSLNSLASSLSKGKGVERVFGMPFKSSQSQSQGRAQRENERPETLLRKSMSSAQYPGTIRTHNIGSPVFDNEATRNMSPVKARAEGKPILLDVKNSLEGGRFSTGGRPVLPEDLASEIQQFMQSEFARQYFTTHKTGFIFRKRIPVEKMMVWQKTPLQAPLLLLNRALQKDAVKTFKVIQRVMGDRDRERPVVRQQASDSHLGVGGPTASLSSLRSMNASSTSLPSMMSGLLEEERWLLSEGLAHGELRDEIYCQLVKQLTGNPNPESLFKGWQLMCVLLVTFPPSKNFEAYLRSFIQHNTTQLEGRVDVIAKYCLQRLSIVSKKGPRGKPPTIAEIETASDAAFNPSTFGESLDAIIRLQERTYPQLQVPIILPFLADGILALGGTKSEGIFRIPGDGDSVSELKIRIERGYYNLEGVDDPHVPASLLKLWLRELADPLVPTELYNDCVACAKDPEACVAMVTRLPTINRRVVLFVISFLQLFLEERVQTVTKMTSANLALVMAPNLLRCDSESMTVVFTNAPYEQMFVHNLLLHLKCNKVDPGYVPKHGLGSAVNTSKPRNRRAGR